MQKVRKITEARKQIQSVDSLFNQQQKAFLDHPYLSYRERVQHLNQLQKMVQSHQAEFEKAIHADFGSRSVDETRLGDIFGPVETTRYNKKHLKSWMKTSIGMPLIWCLPGHARISPQPLGVVGIVAPWNYPLFLSLVPASAALAAGNRVMLKMSESVPITGALLEKMVSNYFDPSVFSVINGTVEIAKSFVRKPFNHLLFTGSTAIGKEVMRAACENLTPVTLELGGKSPTVIAPNYPLKHAAERILWSKLFNAGQTCIAPDYLYLPQHSLDTFIKHATTHVTKWFPTLGDNPDYTAVINRHHHDRLMDYITEAKAQGTQVIEINPAQEKMPLSRRKILPTLVINPSETLKVMQHEIFGPILPIKTYASLDEPKHYIKSRERPLAMYYFDHNKKRVRQMMNDIVCGGMTINDCMWHALQDAIPFGGVGASGMGRYHGKPGFDTFSHTKGSFYQARINATKLMLPPYGKLMDGLLKIMVGK